LPHRRHSGEYRRADRRNTVHEPDRALAGAGVLPDQVGLAVTVEIHCSHYLPLSRHSGEYRRVCGELLILPESDIRHRNPGDSTQEERAGPQVVQRVGKSLRRHSSKDYIIDMLDLTLGNDGHKLQAHRCDDTCCRSLMLLLVGGGDDRGDDLFLGFRL
jgi:hypothetical protein